MEQISFYINDKIHYVQVVRTKNKNMYLKIKSEQIIVTMPHKMPLSIAQSFVGKNLRKFLKYLELQTQSKLFNLETNTVQIFGQKYNFKVLTGFSESTLEITQDLVYFKSKWGETQELNIILNKYLKKSLLSYLDFKIPYFQNLMNVPDHSWKVVNKQSNWGSNVVFKKNLSFASKLSHYDQATIDYVIIHELAHYFEANHSRKFWEVVKRFNPTYHFHIQILKGF